MLELIRHLSKVTPTLLTHVGTTIRIANETYMPLTVENIGPGPRRLPALSLCHYGEQNGDAMRDPEMCFELEIEDGRLVAVQPFYYRNDYAGVEQSAQNQETGKSTPAGSGARASSPNSGAATSSSRAFYAAISSHTSTVQPFSSSAG